MNGVGTQLRLVPTVCFSLILLGGGQAGSQVYKFVDADGVVHFTNVPTDKRFQPLSGPAKPRNKRKARRAKPSPDNFQHRLVTRYDGHIAEAAKRFNLPAALIRAVMAVESNFNPQAVSHAGAQGLMQLMPSTAREMGVEDVFDPRQNILGGTRYLRLMANSFDGDLVLTLAAYNAGHQAVSRHMDIPPYDETQRYVRRVLKLYYFYKKQPPPKSGGRDKSP